MERGLLGLVVFFITSKSFDAVVKYCNSLVKYVFAFRDYFSV